MKAITNFDDISKILRNTIITQSQLSSDRVLNSLSLQGTELDKLLEQNQYNSIEQEDTTILFELNTLNSTSNVSMEEGDIYTAQNIKCSYTTICNNDTICGKTIIDKSITYYQMFDLHLMMYGEDSSFTSAKLIGRLRSQQVKSDLYDLGIYIESITDPQKINDFKNNIMWLRNDIFVNFGVKFSIAPVSSSIEYENIKNLQIEEVNNE